MTPPPAEKVAEPNALYRMYDALKAADVEYSALSTTGINIFAADRKSIDEVSRALNSHAQIGKICTDLRHWQEECGKLHAKLKIAEGRLNAAAPAPSVAQSE